jgi:hypothetical protein
MSTYTHTKRFSIGQGLRQAWDSLVARIPLPKVSVYGLLMIGALFAFESFNYGTTEFALYDLLGDLRFAGIAWSTILALAFCGMDIAGIVRLFTAERSQEESLETWYLLAAWLLAATMNAALTWWAVSLALIGHNGLGNEVLGRETLIGSVPVFVAILVWLLRILIIGSFSMASSRLFVGNSNATPRRQRAARSAGATQQQRSRRSAPSFEPAPKQKVQNGNPQQRPMAARSHRSP